MSVQSRNVLEAMPGTLPELSERTGYPLARVLGYIIEARGNGKPVRVVHNPVRGELAIFQLDSLAVDAENSPQ